MEISSFRLNQEEKGFPVVMTAILVASLLISAAMILQDSGAAANWPADQHFIETADIAFKNNNSHWTFHYPNLQHSGGIASSLIAGAYKLIIPTTKATLNWHIRILAMVMYLSGAWWLARTMIASLPGQILSYLLVCVSGVQFLQPTSDLFAGIFLTFTFISLRLNWPTWTTGFLLAIFSLCKVEMLLTGIAISLFWGFYQWQCGSLDLGP